MSEHKYDVSVVVGRFQPFHKGHLSLIKHAKSIANHTTIIIGSSAQSRDIRNPWSESERLSIIAKAIFDDLGHTSTRSTDYENMIGMTDRIHIKNVPDAPYNEQAWIRRIQMAVEESIRYNIINSKPKVCVVGQQKDYTSYYLKMFPGWSYESTHLLPSEILPVTAKCPVTKEPIQTTRSIDATQIRARYFEYLAQGLKPNYFFTHPDLPAATTDFLNDFSKNPESQRLVDEFEYIQKYKADWASAKYPPTFVTTDAVVTQAGHILMVERKNHPGKGLLALPGGFININERIIDCAIRELKEETRIAVPEAVLRGAIKRSRVYDSPTRSQRGRVISHGYWFDLVGDRTNNHELPKVRKGSDAAKTQWYPLAALRSHQVFEDHYHIILDMLGMNG